MNASLINLGTGPPCAGIRTCRRFDAIGCPSCGPGCNTISYACSLVDVWRCSRGSGGCRGSRSSCRGSCSGSRGSGCCGCLKTKRVSWSISIIRSCCSNSVVITCEIANTTSCPSVWVTSVIHDPSNICTSLSIFILNTVYISAIEIMEHAKVMSKFMCNNPCRVNIIANPFIYVTSVVLINTTCASNPSYASNSTLIVIEAYVNMCIYFPLQSIRYL